ncbi:MAG: CopG family transcriptional regulator [Clostridia bacterium]|nr:CopG family transcriptional regulator [Clostridia bacterium]
MKDKLIITKKGVKGEDGYKVFSIRIREELVEKLDRLAQQTNRSRNDLINTLLDFAVEHSEVEETDE